MTEPDFRQTITTPVAAGTSSSLQLQLTGQHDEELADADLDTVTLTLLDRKTRTVINGRDEEDVYNANGGAVDSSALLMVDLLPEDNSMLGSGYREEHVAILRWTWGGSPENRGIKQIVFPVIRPVEPVA